MQTRRSLIVGALLVAHATWAHADNPARPAPLQTLPAAKLVALAPLLRSSDLVLIEETDKAVLKQLTTVSYAAASPEQVREVVVHPERYKDFVRNTKQDDVRTEPEGTLFHRYSVNYTIYTVDGRHRYVLLPKGAGDAAAPVDIYDPDPGGTRHYRWEFLAAPNGGTVVVLYGYSKVPRDGFITKFLDRAPTLEFGLALIPQMTLMIAMRDRAVELNPNRPPAPTGTTGSYDFLLDRGTVALFRSQGGHVRDLSLVHRTSARPEVLMSVIGEAAQWSSFIPTLNRSTGLGQKDGLSGVEIEQSLPLMSWTTTWAYRADAQSADCFAVGGDLHGSRLRWDVRARGSDRAELVLRAIQDFGQGSMVIRQLYKLEPLFEFGIDVGLELLYLQGIRHRAEQLTANRATR
jgi:hypothetical protein